MEDGAPAGPMALETAILELIAHGHRDAAARLMEEEPTELEATLSAFPDPAVWNRIEFLYELDRLNELHDALGSRDLTRDFEDLRDDPDFAALVAPRRD